VAIFAVGAADGTIGESLHGAFTYCKHVRTRSDVANDVSFQFSY
jgi:hypothetical protein